MRTALVRRKGPQTPSGRPEQFEEDVPSDGISAAARRGGENVRGYFRKTIGYLMGASCELYASLEVKVLQRIPRPRCCTVDLQGEDLSTSQLSSHCLLEVQHHQRVLLFTEQGRLPILPRSLQIFRFRVYTSMLGFSIWVCHSQERHKIQQRDRWQ
jgi:hypothetical protein